MKHPDEHTIDLLILEPEALGEQLAVIEAHLAECAGCRLLAEKLAGLYRDAETEYAKETTPAIRVEEAVARRDGHLSRDRETVRVSYRRMRPSALARMRTFSRHHPVTAAGGAVSLFALIGVLGMFMLKAGRQDMNPAYVHLNPGEEMFEVYDAQNQLLSRLPAEGLKSAEYSQEKHRVRLSQVSDLDGDGVNEVVTGIPLSVGTGQDKSALRIINAQGRILAERRLGRPVSFAGSDYSGLYPPTAVLIDSTVPGGGKEILAVASNSHSPSVITRLSATGEILGEYWHYGTLFGAYLVEHGGRSLLIACGADDTPDTTGEWGRTRAMILVLDPAKITGATECSFAPGFGFPASRAELRYIVLPRSDIHEALKAGCGAMNMVQERDSTLSFSVSGSSDSTSFSFVFTNDLRPLAVRSSTFAEKLHADLVAQGKLTSRWGAAYFEELRRRVVIVK